MPAKTPSGCVCLPRQGGAVLIISLLMLIAATLLAMTAINDTTVSLKIVRNTEMNLEAEAVAQTEIEKMLDGDLSTWPTAPGTVSDSYYQGSVYSPTCLEKITGGSGTSADVKYAGLAAALSSGSSSWEVVANVTESQTGARATVHQGVIWSSSVGASCTDFVEPEEEAGDEAGGEDGV
jgi:hypothetical protein